LFPNPIESRSMGFSEPHTACFCIYVSGVDRRLLQKRYRVWNFPTKNNA